MTSHPFGDENIALMSAFDDLSPGTALPPISSDAITLLQDVQNTGTTCPLVTVDEAELAAVGLVDAARRGRPAIAPAELTDAAARLITRGLAERAPWHAGAFRPAGDLLLYAQLALHPRTRMGLTQSWTEPEPPAALRERRRISLLTEAAPGSGLACVETSAVPADAPASVPVSVALLRLDVLVTTVVDAAFAPLPGGTVRETVLAVADRSDTLTTSRLRVDADGRGELQPPPRGRLRVRKAHAGVDRHAYADHVRERLITAG
jgi:hypothetical protein